MRSDGYVPKDDGDLETQREEERRKENRRRKRRQIVSAKKDRSLPDFSGDKNRHGKGAKDVRPRRGIDQEPVGGSHEEMEEPITAMGKTTLA